MEIFKKTRAVLYQENVRDLDVDGKDLIEAHSDSLAKKKLLRSAFEYFYIRMLSLAKKYLDAIGPEYELGSGVGFFKNLNPDLITSDIRMISGIDMILDAQSMDLPDDSVRCIYAINVFHHLPNPHLFFSELIRVLKPGGGCILVEPHNGFCSSILHKNLHKDEYFDPNESSWEAHEIRGPLSGANQALAHIVFTRDKERFHALYGESLEIVHQGYCLNSLRYFFSGGLNFRQLAPSFFNSLFIFIENFGAPVAKFWTFHQVTVIVKK